jgi:hypothetical protein
MELGQYRKPIVQCERENALTCPFVRLSFAALINHNYRCNQTALEQTMKYANALLACLGLAAKAEKAPDAFDLRLRRIEAREAKYAAQQTPFKNQRTLLAA